MSKNLEDFVKSNREDFDKFEPGPVVWHNIQQELKKTGNKKGILISMRVLRWSAAAAILLVLGAGTWYVLTNKKKPPEIAGRTMQPKNHNQPAFTPPDTVQEAPDSQQNTASTDKKENAQAATADDQEYTEELYHYTRLVELKQNEIKKIKKDEPLLYQQFAGDFNKLDSIFHILKKKLPANPNREQILEAMIQNLQYQEALLNQQLNIIKKINTTKKQEYEKAYRSA